MEGEKKQKPLVFSSKERPAPLIPLSIILGCYKPNVKYKPADELHCKWQQSECSAPPQNKYFQTNAAV